MPPNMQQHGVCRNRTQRHFNESKELEAQVDAEIKRVEQIQQQQANNQQLKML